MIVLPAELLDLRERILGNIDWALPGKGDENAIVGMAEGVWQVEMEDSPSVFAQHLATSAVLWVWSLINHQVFTRRKGNLMPEDFDNTPLESSREQS
jgi:hypothetical protein